MDFSLCLEESEEHLRFDLPERTQEQAAV